MRKILIFLVLFTIILSSVFAYSSNGQKIYDLETDIYEAIEQLYILTGHALPSTTGPYSQAEFESMMKKINKDELPGYGKSLYDYVDTELNKTPFDEEENFGLKFSIDANLEVYTHTNTTESRFQTKYNWGYGDEDQKPMLNIALETWPTKYFYGYFEYALSNSIATNTIGEFGSDNIHTNILGFQNLNGFKFTAMNDSQPYRAFVSAGSYNWSLQIGRDRLSWGAGESGNLMIGDHLLYHNMLRLTTFSKSFKYTFLTSFFPHPQNYYTDGADSKFIENTGASRTITGISMYMSHRLEGRFFGDKLNFALTESIIYETKDSFLDLQTLNPSMLYHSYFTADMQNSILSLELDYTPWKYFNIYGQLGIDEFATPGESTAGNEKPANPNAIAFLTGIKGNYPLGNGLLMGSIEFVKTNPFFYLRKTKDDNNSYGLDFIVPIRQYARVNDPKVTYDEAAIGYKWGNDVVALNLNVGYKQYGNWDVQANALFLWDGTYDIWTAWKRVVTIDSSTEYPEHLSSPTSDGRNTYNYRDDEAHLRDAVSLMTNLRLKGSYAILDYLKVYGQLDYFNIQNPGNKKDAAAINDVQFTIGVGYSF